MFRSWFGRKPVPLTGAPAVRRQKTYSARSGYVYQYFYEGQRPAQHEPGAEFVFDVSADRKTSAPVSVFVLSPAVEAWERTHGRELTGTERYAIAKIALFQAFDERESPAAMNAPVRVEADAVADILQSLEID
jgi:hypothetical protein